MDDQAPQKPQQSRLGRWVVGGSVWIGANIVAAFVFSLIGAMFLAIASPQNWQGNVLPALSSLLPLIFNIGLFVWMWRRDPQWVVGALIVLGLLLAAGMAIAAACFGLLAGSY